MKIDELLEEFSQCSEVEAIAIGGSRATGCCDAKSDYDIYLYVRCGIEERKRREILGKYCSVMELGNHYWELEDNCTLTDGVDLDLIYRNLDSFGEELADVVERYRASGGYTTCMWHNIRTCRIVYDELGRLSEMKKRFDVPYPPKLRENIIDKNRKLLSGVLPSYDAQIKKAVLRGDRVSINHRVAEFLASYFDVLFAVNEVPHPGEKRLMRLCSESLPLLPERFEENLERLFLTMYDGDVMSVIYDIIRELDVLISSVQEER